MDEGGGISLSVTDGAAKFVNENGFVFTAADVDVRPGDFAGVELSGPGPYFVVHRNDVEVGRYPMRDAAGWHFSDLRQVVRWSNPVLPR